MSLMSEEVENQAVSTPTIRSKKRFRESPGKSANANKKVKKPTSSEAIPHPSNTSSSSDSIEDQVPQPSRMLPASITPTSFAELLRDANVKQAFNEIIQPAVEDAVKSSLSSLENRIKKVEDSTANQDSEIEELKTRLDTIDQVSRINNIIVSGFSEVQDEKLLERFLKFSSDYLMTILQAEDIMAIFRLGKIQPDKSKSRPILVKFKTSQQKLDVYKARIHLRRMDIGKDHPHSSPIFLNEDLTPRKAALYKQCREALKDKKVFNCWTFNGVIWVKLTKNGEPSKINSDTDITSLL